MFKIQYIILLIFILTIFDRCKIHYDMTGAEIKGKTISVAYFNNQAPIVQPTLSNEFTEALKDRFNSQTNVPLVNGIGEMHFEGEIKGYDIKPQDITGEEKAAMMRLTITVRVKFTNIAAPETDFDQTFSKYADYAADKNIDAVASILHKDIIEQLTEQIFNKAFVNW